MLPHFSSFLRICFFKKEKKPNFPDLQHCCQQVHPANGTVEGMYLFPVKKRTMLLIQPFPFRDRLCPVLALFLSWCASPRIFRFSKVISPSYVMSRIR